MSEQKAWEVRVYMPLLEDMLHVDYSTNLKKQELASLLETVAKAIGTNDRVIVTPL